MNLAARAARGRAVTGRTATGAPRTATTGTRRSRRSPWRALAYVALRAPLPLMAAAALAMSTAGAREGREAESIATGIVVAVGYVLVGVVTAPVERRAVALIGQHPVPPPPPRTEPGGLFAVVRHRAIAPTTWREAGYSVLRLPVAVVDALLVGTWLVAAPALLAAPVLVASGPVTAGPLTLVTTSDGWTAAAVGAAIAVAGSYVVVVQARAHAALARMMLGPHDAELQAQVTDLTRSRLRLLDAFDVERRRIERDLHDGAQQQLVALAMTLDLARIELGASEHTEAARLVEQAHGHATRTIGELRDLIHAIHPPALVEFGLPAAARELAARCALPVRVSAHLPHRLPAAVETTAFFVFAEALTNAAKHSGAAVVELRAGVDDDMLVLTVTDDGTGGADPDAGSGLTGLADRVSALGGRFTLSSPRGGPTVVRATIPLDGLRGSHMTAT